MRENRLKNEIEPLCREVGRALVHDFLSRMDQDYFSLYTPPEVAEHIRMSSRLDAAHPVVLSVDPLEDRHFKIVVVAFDYFSEFSILCGLLSSFGLDILSGNVYTFSDRPIHSRNTGEGLKGTRLPREGVAVRRRIVDVFHVRLMGSEERFGAPQQRRFEEALQVLIHLLDEGRYKEARERVNRRLIQFLGKAQDGIPDLQGDLLHPIHVQFNNRSSKQWTLLDIHGKDIPIFLYAFSNALAMRNIYIHKIKIKKIGHEIQDRLYISDRRGEKIQREADIKALRVSAALIKQFTHFLTGAPDPTMAIAHFDQFLDKIIEGGRSRTLLSFLKKKETMKILARLFGTSNFLWEDFLRMQFENLLPILEHFKKKALRIGRAAMRRDLRQRLGTINGLEEAKTVVNAYKDQEMFRIDIRHLIEPPGNLTHFSEALTDLAEVVIDQAYHICNRHLERAYGTPLQADGAPCPLSICGLGKFGGRELGYASDIELLFVYGGRGKTKGKTQGKGSIDNSIYFEKLSQQIIRFIQAKKEGIFHIDTRLRPYGDSGRLAISLEQMTNYYAPTGEAAPFERQAIIKLRKVAGDRSLGRRCEAVRDRFVYSNLPWDLKGALALRERQMNELAPHGKINVKYSPGGLLDIEYLAQYLQIIHGNRHSDLRTPNTLTALRRLSKHGIIPAVTGRDLQRTYLFLRTLIDALRIVRGHAKDLLLPEARSEEFTFLGRRMAYGQRDWEKGRIALEADIQRHMKNAHEAFLSLFKPSQ